MRLNATHYLEAALERLGDAYELHDHGRYSFAIYASGRAVESIFRAAATKKGAQLDAGHDLVRLFRFSGFAKAVPERLRAEVTNALITVWLRWDNNLRFCGKKRVLAHLRRRGLTAGIRRDALKYNSKRAYEAADVIVRAGASAWN